MLDKPAEEIVYENGVVVGVKSGGEVIIRYAILQFIVIILSLS